MNNLLGISLPKLIRVTPHTVTTHISYWMCCEFVCSVKTVLRYAKLECVWHVTGTISSLMHCSCHFVLLEARSLINVCKQVQDHTLPKYETVHLCATYACMCVNEIALHLVPKCEMRIYNLVDIGKYYARPITCI